MNDKIFEVNDEVEQAYRQGFEAGTKFEAAKEMAELTKCLIKGVTKAVTQTINDVDYDAVYSVYKSQETEEKHWNECRQISEYDRELREAKRLLGEMLKVMNDGSCAKSCASCMYIISGCNYGQPYKWKHTDEVVKLIGGGEEE